MVLPTNSPYVLWFSEVDYEQGVNNTLQGREEKQFKPLSKGLREITWFLYPYDYI